MHILICSKVSLLCKNLIHRLHQARHEIYLLDGAATEEKKPASVFQAYRMPYAGENTFRVISSANPEVMVIMGSCDPTYSWQNQERDAVRYISDLNNLLMGAQGVGVKRIIYLSSLGLGEKADEKGGIFGAQNDEETVRMQTYARAETICRDFCKGNMEIVILRMPRDFGGYEENEGHDICLRMVMEAIREKKVHYINGIWHELTYCNDAADAVFRMVSEKAGDSPEIAEVPGHRIREEELAGLVAQIVGGEDEIGLIGEGSAEAAAGEMPETAAEEAEETAETVTEETQETTAPVFYCKFSMEQGLASLYEECLAAWKKEKRKKRHRFGFLRPVEAVAIIVPVHLLSLIFHENWVGNYLDLYSIYTLVFGACYGTAYGLFAALLAAIAKGLLWMEDGQSFLEIVGSYGYFLFCLQFVLVGVVSGYMRDKYNRRNHILTEEKEYLSVERDDILRINRGNNYVKNVYEKRLESYQNSLARIYDMTSQLDIMVSQKVVYQAVKVVRELMEIDDAAIYIGTANSSYLRLAARSTRKAEGCGKSLHFAEDLFLYEAVSRREIYENRSMETNLPTFAGGVWHQEELLALIMVWTDDLRRVTLYESNLLALLCRLVENAMVRAGQYEQALLQEAYDENSGIMKQEYFLKMLYYYREGEKEGLLEFSIVRVYAPPEGSADQLCSLIRNTDVAGYVDGDVCIILSGTVGEDIGFVEERIRKNGFRAVAVYRGGYAGGKSGEQ